MKIIFILLFTWSPWIIAAESLIEVHHLGKVEERSKSKARTAITKQAIDEVSYRYIKELIGEAKFEKDKENIKNKIVNNYLKYVPILKVTNIQRSKEGTEADVYMKLSIENLKKLLLRSGLLYESKGTPVVLPLISVVDRVNGKSYSWWTGQENLDLLQLKEWMRLFHKELKVFLMKKDFFSLQPIEWDMYQGIPKVFRSENPRTEDLLFVAQSLSSAIVVRGHVKITKSERFENSYTLNVRLEALQSSNGRVIGEVIRRYETEIGPFQAVVNDSFLQAKESLAKDLSNQIVDAWQKGTFGSSLLQMTFNGKLNYRQLEDLKTMMNQRVREIRGLRERYLSAGKYTFEVDSSLPSIELAKVIKRKKFPRYKVEVEEVKANRLALRVNIR